MRPNSFRLGVFRQGWRAAVVSVALAICVYLFNDVYALLNHGPARMVLQTPIDRAIPVVPLFAIPYVSLDYYVYLSLILFLLWRQQIFQRAAVAMLLAWAVSYLVYLVAQTYVARPVLTGTDPLTQLIRDVYESDAPYNAFPSLHVSISTIMALHWWAADRRLGAIAAAWTALIIPSTLFLHQHYLADVGGGLVVAFAATRLAALVQPRLPWAAGRIDG